MPRRKRRTKRRKRRKRRKTRRRKGGRIIDYLYLRPGMVVKPLPPPSGGGEFFWFAANEVWKITSMQNNTISYDVLSPAGKPSDEVSMAVIDVLGIRFDLVEKASPQSLVTAIPKFAAMKSKKRNPSSIQQLALNKISTLDRKFLKENMPGLLKPKKIKYKT